MTHHEFMKRIEALYARLFEPQGFESEDYCNFRANLPWPVWQWRPYIDLPLVRRWRRPVASDAEIRKLHEYLAGWERELCRREAVSA